MVTKIFDNHSVIRSGVVSLNIETRQNGFSRWDPVADRTAFTQKELLRQVPVDGLVRADNQDVLLAMTFRPYRREVVEAVQTARAQGVTIIAISDSPVTPIFEGANYRFLVSVDTPLMFISTVALSALLESLMAFVISDLDESVIASIERFHQRRYDLRIYLGENQ